MGLAWLFLGKGGFRIETAPSLEIGFQIEVRRFYRSFGMSLRIVPGATG